MTHSTEWAEGTVDTMIKLAAALDVSLPWLAFGIGGPLDSHERPNRERAAELCREYGISDEAVEHVLGEVVTSEEDLPVLAWVDRMRLREAELRSRRNRG